MKLAKKLTKKQPLFIVTGASCVGKSTLCNELFINEKEYIVMESDLLWNVFMTLAVEVVIC